MREHIGREHPAEGVYIFRDLPTIVLLTVCSRRRRPLLANRATHDALIASWDKANAWLVRFYLIMPDHVHLFCAPSDEEPTIEQWVTFWKRSLRRKLRASEAISQSRGFHHRLRRGENYSEKWEYV